MTIRLTDYKVHSIHEKILKFLNMKKPTIKDLSLSLALLYPL